MKSYTIVYQNPFGLEKSVTFNNCESLGDAINGFRLVFLNSTIILIRGAQ